MIPFVLLLLLTIFILFFCSILSRISETRKEISDFKRDMEQNFSSLKKALIPESTLPLEEPEAPEIELKKEDVAPLAVPPPLPKSPGVEETPLLRAAPAVQKEPSQFETAVKGVLTKVWNWIVVGEEHRPEGVTMEYAIASNWLLRIGVLILVIGIGFFLKYSIATGLIGPDGRIALGTLSGIAMLATGVRLFDGKYRLIGQGLCGGGIAVLYASFFAGQYMERLSPTVAFGLMVLVTLVAGFLAVKLDSLLIAFMGLLGGYGTPVFLNPAGESLSVLFSYMTILGVGVLLISWRKNWRLLYYSAFIATYSIFAVKMNWDTTTVFWECFPFLLGFFFLFSTVTFVFQFANREKSTLLELLFLFLNAGVFSFLAYHLVTDAYPRETLAILTIGLAAFYIAHIYLFLYRKLLDRGLLMSFIGLASFFVAITLPIVLSEGWITVSWAIQGFVMLWIASKLGSEFLKNLAYLLYAIVIGRLVGLEMGRQFEGAVDYSMSGLIHRLFLFGIPVVSLFAAHRLLRLPSAGGGLIGAENDISSRAKPSVISQCAFWSMAFVAFLYLNFEFYSTFGNLYAPIVNPALTILWLGLGCIAFAQWRMTGQKWIFALFATIMGLTLLKLLVFDLFWFANRGYSTDFKKGFSMRMIDFGSVIAMLTFGFLYFRKNGGKGAVMTFGYLGLGLFFIYSTLELLAYAGKYLPEFVQGGLSIYWAAFGIALLLVGIMKQLRHLRWVALLLLSVVILKVFFSDLSGLEQIYRIIAFIVLGILVIGGSFLYLKFRANFEMTDTQK